MASEADICNMALSAIGDDAIVTSISPPDGSAQAGHCARFYPQARRELFNDHNFGFTRVRTSNLAPIAGDSDSAAWAFRYALPADCMKPRKLIANGATDERSGVDFEVQAGVIYTNHELPTLIYTKDVTDTTKFTPGVVRALSLQLAAWLCGPIVKDIKRAESFFTLAASAAEKAIATEANATSQVSNEYVPAQLAARGALAEDLPPVER